MGKNSTASSLKCSNQEKNAKRNFLYVKILKKYDPSKWYRKLLTTSYLLICAFISSKKNENNIAKLWSKECHEFRNDQKKNHLLYWRLILLFVCLYGVDIAAAATIIEEKFISGKKAKKEIFLKCGSIVRPKMENKEKKRSPLMAKQIR